MRIVAMTATKRATATRPGRVILVERDHPYHPFITAWQGGEPDNYDNQWCWGHYFKTFSDAAKDFDERSKRGY